MNEKTTNIKTLANCSDLEFLRQTNKIRHAVEKWLTATELAEIRQRLPKHEEIPEDADAKQIESIIERNRKHEAEQVRKNIDDFLDAMLDKHPEETLNVIRLCCFAEDDKEQHNIVYYMKAFTEMLSNEDVLDFFTLLVQLAQRFGLTL